MCGERRLTNELGSDERDKQIIEKKILYTKKQIKKLEANKGDVTLIHKYEDNIKQYENELSKMK